MSRSKGMVRRRSSWGCLVWILVFALVLGGGAWAAVRYVPALRARAATVPLMGKLFFPQKAPEPTTEEKEAARLAQQAAQLEQQSKELAAKEADLQAREKALEEKQKALGQKTVEVTNLEAQLKAERLNLDRLGRVYGEMKPNQAVATMESLPDDLVLKILGRVPEEQAAKILGLMNADRAARLVRLMENS